MSTVVGVPAGTNGVPIPGLNPVTNNTPDVVVDVVAPRFSIIKTVSPSVTLVGGLVTYSYAVTNTGDTALTNVVVTDDVLGSIGEIPLLAQGGSSLLSTSVTVSVDTTNVATVVGVPAGTNGVPIPGLNPGDEQHPRCGG